MFLKLFTLSFSIILLLSAVPSQAALIINEVLADPSNTPAPGSSDNIDANGDGTASGTADEFVELVNDSAASLDISGWTLDDAAGDAIFRHTFPASTILAPGQAVVVFGGGSPPFPNVHGGAITQAASSGGLGLNNGGDTVTLSDATNTLIASMTYGIEANTGQSLTRSPDITGAFVEHYTLNSIAATPGFRTDGVTPFGASVPVPEPSGVMIVFASVICSSIYRRN